MGVRDCRIAEVIVAARKDDGVDGGKVEGFVLLCVGINFVLPLMLIINEEREFFWNPQNRKFATPTCLIPNRLQLIR